MKISRDKLKQIIKEEIDSALAEASPSKIGTLSGLEAKLNTLTLKLIKKVDVSRDDNTVTIYTNIKTPDGFPETIEEILSDMIPREILASLYKSELSTDFDGNIVIHTYLQVDENDNLTVSTT